MKTNNPQLEVLKLEGCPWIAVVSFSSPALREVNLASCNGLESIDVECSALTTLHLSWCTKLSLIKVIAPHLVYMDLEGSGGSITMLHVVSERMTTLDIKNMLKPADLIVKCPLTMLRFTKSLHISEVTRNIHRI